MKEEALKLADWLDDGEVERYDIDEASTMIRRLVEHIEGLENPIMQAISTAFAKPLSDEEIRKIHCITDGNLNLIKFARAIEERHGIK